MKQSATEAEPIQRACRVGWSGHKQARLEWKPGFGSSLTGARAYWYDWETAEGRKVIAGRRDEKRPRRSISRAYVAGYCVVKIDRREVRAIEQPQYAPSPLARTTWASLGW